MTLYICLALIQTSFSQLRLIHNMYVHIYLCVFNILCALYIMYICCIRSRDSKHRKTFSVSAWMNEPLLRSTWHERLERFRRFPSRFQKSAPLHEFRSSIYNFMIYIISLPLYRGTTGTAVVTNAHVGNTSIYTCTIALVFRDDIAGWFTIKMLILVYPSITYLKWFDLLCHDNNIYSIFRRYTFLFFNWDNLPFL